MSTLKIKVGVCFFLLFLFGFSSEANKELIFKIASFNLLPLVNQERFIDLRPDIPLDFSSFKLTFYFSKPFYLDSFSCLKAQDPHYSLDSNPECLAKHQSYGL